MTAETHVQPTVGLTGFGLLGRALALRLRAAGVAVMALDVLAERRADMERCEVEMAETLADLAERCATLIVVVFDTEQVREVLTGLAALPAVARARGTTILCTTTLAPSAVSDLAALVQPGDDFIEFPVSGTSAQILAGEGLGLVGGDPGIAEKLRPLLDILTPRHIHIGPLGAAARAKLAINLVLELNRSALAEGFVFAETMGLDLAAYEAALKLSAAASKVMDGKGPKMRLGDFSAEGRCAQSLKDVRMMLASAEQCGQPLPLTLAQADLLQACVTAGDGDRDGSVVIQELRRRRGRTLPSASRG